MAKRLNLLILTVLLLSQTIIGPIGSTAGLVSAAEQNGQEEKTKDSATIVVDELEEVLTKAEQYAEEDYTEASYASFVEAVTAGKALLEDDADATQEEVDNAVTAVEEAIDALQKQTIPEDEDDADGNDIEKEEVVEEESDDEETQTAPRAATMQSEEAKEFKDEDLTFNFGKIVIGDKEITEAKDADDLEFSKGDKIQLHYTFKIDASEDYGAGSYFTFDLPKSLINFNTGSLTGSFDTEFGTFNYETENNVVIVTLDAPLHSGQYFDDGNLNFFGTLGDEGADDGLEQEVEIPVKGSDSIKIPLVYKPSTSNKSMSKKGTSEVQSDGTRVINWEVWVNESGKDLVNPKVNDKTDGKHELNGDITVEKYKVNINGVSDTAESTTRASSFPVDLDDGRYAYKLIYQTKVTAAPEESKEKYTNTAKLTDNDTETDSASASVYHEYGTKLEKNVKSGDKYRTTWEVKYNYFGATFDETQTLTDELGDAPHVFVDGTVKVHEVTFDAQGNPTPGDELDTQPKSEIKDNGKTLEIELDSSNGEAYYITYETEHEDEYITGGSGFWNSASYEGGSDKAWRSISEGIFSKSRGNIDHDKKLVTWTLSFTPEQDMVNVTIEDLFENYTDGGTRQTLVNWDGSNLDSDNVKAAFNNTSNIKVATLKDDVTEGFELDLGDLKQGNTITIQYKTKLDFLPNGGAYDEYKNKATASWKSPNSDEKPSITKFAEYKPEGSTKNNGYKNGKFDHVEQVFNWELAVNITKQNIAGGKVVDTIGEGHELIEDSIKVYKLNLGENDQEGSYDEGSPVGSEVYEVTEKDKKGFTIEFNENMTAENNNEAYIITYQTKDEDDIIGHENGNRYGNKATYTTPEDENFELTASTTVEHANELIDKDADVDKYEETITWTIDVNKSHSHLGNIVLTDSPSKNQLILDGTFKKREIKLDQEGKVTHGDWESVTADIDHENNTFTIDLGELNKKGYQIRYTTFFQGDDGEEFSNEASINWEGTVSGVDTETDFGTEQFFYAQSSGSASSSKGTLKLEKVGVNPLTGEVEKLEGVQFELKTISEKFTLAEGTTDADGTLTLEDVRYGTYKLKEVNTPDGYKALDTNPFEFKMDDDRNNVVYVVENIKDVDLDNVCPEFTITVEKVNGEKDPNKAVKLIHERTGKIIEVTTDDEGQIIKDREDLPAGKYTVYENKETGNVDDDIYIGEITVNYEMDNYEDCSAKVRPEVTSISGTKTWKDGGLDNEERPNITIQLFAGGDKLNEITIDETNVSSDDENVWEYTFENLRKMNNAGTEEIEYAVKELDVEGYKSEQDGTNFTNTRTGETEVSVTKEWEGPKTDSVTINLLADGEKEAELELSETNSWMGSFEGLAIYNDEGEEIEYTVEEVAVDGYNTKITGNAEDGFTVTNTQKTYAIGDYVWVDYNSDGTQDESADAALEGVTVELYKVGGEDEPFKTTTTDEKGLYIFDELLAGEYQIKFILTEEQAKRYKFTEQNAGDDITVDSDADVDTGWTEVIKLDDENKQLTKDYDAQTVAATEGIDPTWDAGVIELTDITVSKTWVDDDNATGDRPESITVNLKQDTEVIDTIEIEANDDDEWTHTFTGLTKYLEEGKEYEYTVSEHEVAGYATEIDGFEITNTRAAEKSIEITKAWKDTEETADRPESIEVELFRSVEGGTKESVDTYTVTAANDWKRTVDELPAFDNNGKAYTYTIVEDPVDGYDSKVDGFDITNLRVGTTEVSGTKIWENDKEEIRPDSITVNLLQNGESIASQEVTAQDNWEYSFTDLPEFDEDGAAYTYTIDEEEIAEYNIVIDGYDITNTRKDYAIGDYVWVDRNKDGIQDANEEPIEGVKVELYEEGNDEPIEITETDENGHYIFDKLTSGNYKVKFTLTKDQEKKYRFTKEQAGEDTTIDSDANEETGWTRNIVLNEDNEYLSTEYDAQEYEASEGIDPTWDAGVIELVDVSGTKTWEKDKADDRPDFITINLLQNGAQINSQDVTAADDWTYSFTGLDQYDEDGVEYEYTIEEVAVDGYETSYNGYDITNTKLCETFTVEIKDHENKPVVNEEFTFESEDGKTKVTGTTDKDGKITFDRGDLPEGTYTVIDKDGNVIGEIVVTYNVDCADNLAMITLDQPAVEEDLAKEEDQGGILPKTATEIFTWIALGIGLLALGITFRFTRRRKNA